MRTRPHSTKHHETLAEALQGKFTTVESGCWEWIRCLTPRGYGQLTWSRRHYSAHRAMWESINGTVPSGLMVLHKCDNRKCVNPAHLFLGTAQDNTNDMMRKGRHVSPRKSACIRGHDMTEAYVSPSGSRNCRICQAARNRAYEERKKYAVT